MPPFAFLYRMEILLGRLRAARVDPRGTEAEFEPVEAFEEVRPWFERAAAEESFEAGWKRFVEQLHLSLVFADGERTGEFRLELQGARARVSWAAEESREAGE